MSVIDEPAAGAAASRCVVARSVADGKTRNHPRPCGWCDYPLTELDAMVQGWIQWAKGPGRFDADSFQALKTEVREALILEAQALVDDRPPAADEAPVVAVPDPSPEEQEEALPWLA